MLCPQCRRMVGKDGYCPMGHLARPELQVEQPRVASPPPPPPPPPPPARQPAPERDPYTPPGLGPSNPPPHAGAPSTEGTSPPGGAFPPPPSVPSEQPVAVGAKLRTRLTAIVIALGLAVVATLGFVVFGGSAGAANLKYVFSPGETHRYQLSMTMSFAGGNLKGGARFDGTIDMIIRQVVKAVDRSGVATIEFRIDRATMTERGKSQRVPVPADILTIKMSPEGRIVGLEGGAIAALQDINPAAGILGPESFGPILPNHKVEPGDSWPLDADVPNPFGDALHITGKATLVERRDIAGQPGVVIRSAINSPMNVKIEFAKLAEIIGDDIPDEIRKAAMTLQGHISMNMTQAFATTSGYFQSATGDMKMTGTFAILNVPGLEESGVIDLSMQLTMTEI